jgi:hypothetical protein
MLAIVASIMLTGSTLAQDLGPRVQRPFDEIGSIVQK